MLHMRIPHSPQTEFLDHERYPRKLRPHVRRQRTNFGVHRDIERLDDPRDSKLIIA
jgi:hypothetical protein